MEYKEFQQRIVKEAKSLEGITEIKGNQGFTDPKIMQEFLDVGFVKGHAYCVYTTEVIWMRVYKGINDLGKLFKTLFSGSATKTYKQFKEYGWNVGQVPEVGSIVIWRLIKGGKPSWKGHAGIVIGYDDKYIYTTEGNTNGGGSREGDGIYPKQRKYAYKVSNGLQLEGFIYPVGIDAGVPFENKEQGNKFRKWVNDYHPEVAKRINLDPSGAFYNSFIRKAWDELGFIYINTHNGEL